MLAPHEPMELIVEHVAHRRLEREPFLLGTGRPPLDFFGHFQPGRPAFGKDLEPPAPAGSGWRRPRARGGSARTRYGRSRPGGMRRRNTRSPAPLPRRRATRSPGNETPVSSWEAPEKRNSTNPEIAAGIDQQRRWRDLGRRAGNRIAIEPVESRMPHDQTGRPNWVARSSLRRKVAG